jgi:hemoglobin/transferrin/lactoferrin receptor protein
MRILCFIFAFASGIWTSGLSQILIVVDSEDLRPIPDVTVMNPEGTKHIFTNRNGKADISDFGDSEMVCLQHFTYERVCLSFPELKQTEFKVLLIRKVFAIEEFVISANRWEQNKNEVPNRITTVLKPAVELQNPQTAADLVGISDEVFIQKSQLGGGSPMIRGFATNRVLIVVDGVRMNNAIYREGNIQNIISLDPSAMESTEIIFGPGAIVYGSDAIGGVMDFHTKNALLSTGDQPILKLNASTRFSSADREKSAHFDFNAGNRKIALLAGITWSDFDDLKMGSWKHEEYLRPEYVTRIEGKDTVVSNPDPRVQIYSGYNQINTLNKLRIKLSGNVDLVLANHFSKLSDVPRYDRLIQYKSGKLRYGDWYYGPQVWMMNSAGMTLNKENRVFDELRVTAAHQSYKESRHDRSFGKDIINEQTEKLSIVSLNIDFDKTFGKEKELVYYGLEFVNNNIVSVARTRDIVTGLINPAGSRYPNGNNSYTSLSIYGGYKNNLSEKFTINTGIRYNHISLNSEIGDNSYYQFPFTKISMSNGALTGSAGVVFRQSEKFHLGMNISTGFRAPNLDDAGKVFDSAPGVVVVPNPDLKPEYAYNADLSLVKDFGKILHTEFTLYHTWLTDAMIRRDFLFNGKDSIDYLGEPSKVEAVTNAGSARVYGFHFNMQLNITKYLFLRSALNITEGFEEDGIPLRHAAPAFGSTHLVFELPKLKSDLYVVYNGAKKYERMPPSEIEKPYLYSSDENGNPWSPGWFTLNLKLSYEFLNRISVTGGIENILDVRYRPYSSGIVSPGRNFIISLRLAL